jgi:Flp pilus assembly protein TadG
MRTLRQFPSLVRRLRHDRFGVAVTEFALVAPVLATLLVGVVDIGGAVYQQAMLQQALRAGGQYAVSFPTQSGSIDDPNNGILLAIQQALPANLTNVTVATPVVTLGPPSYVALSASCPFSPLLLPITTLSVNYVVRIQ